MIDSPVIPGSIERENLCALNPFGARPVLPVAVAGVEFPAMRGEYADFRTAHEPARIIPRPWLERDVQNRCQSSDDRCDVLRAARGSDDGDASDADHQAKHGSSPIKRYGRRACMHRIGSTFRASV